MLEDLREIPAINPLATDLAFYEMLGLIFRGKAEARSKISREVTHDATDPWAWVGDGPPAPTHGEATSQARVPPFCGLARPSSLPASPWPWTFPSSSPRSEPHNPVRRQREPGPAFSLANSSWASSSSSCGNAANVLGAMIALLRGDPQAERPRLSGAQVCARMDRVRTRD
jgi:hypothetical protein